MVAAVSAVPILAESVDPQADSRVNILLVDDLPEKHLVMGSILEELGQNIVSARSGREALQLILQMEFAVILLDVNMPDIDGLETASLIRQYKKTSRTPILFITAYVDEVQAARGYALGAVDYISSPVIPDILRSKVKVFVELHRMNRQLQQQAAEREALARSEAARHAAEQAILRADYISDASQRLVSSLNLNATVDALADVAVPALGRLAALVLLDSPRQLRCRTVKHCSSAGVSPLPAPPPGPPARRPLAAPALPSVAAPELGLRAVFRGPEPAFLAGAAVADVHHTPLMAGHAVPAMGDRPDVDGQLGVGVRLGVGAHWISCSLFASSDDFSCYGTLATMTPGSKCSRVLIRSAGWLCTSCAHHLPTKYSGM